MEKRFCLADLILVNISLLLTEFRCMLLPPLSPNPYSLLSGFEKSLGAALLHG